MNEDNCQTRLLLDSVLVPDQDDVMLQAAIRVSLGEKEEKQPLKARKCCIFHYDVDSVFVLDDGTRIHFNRASLLDYGFWDHYLRHNEPVKLPTSALTTENTVETIVAAEGNTQSTNTVPLLDQPMPFLLTPSLSEYPIQNTTTDLVDYISYVSCPNEELKLWKCLKDTFEKTHDSMNPIILAELDKISKIMFYAKKFDTDFVIAEIGRNFARFYIATPHTFLLLRFFNSIGKYEALFEEAVDLALVYLERSTHQPKNTKLCGKRIIEGANNNQVQRVFERALYLRYGVSSNESQSRKSLFKI